MLVSPCAVDLYAKDLNGQPNLSAYVSAGAPWNILLLKATEGIYYPATDSSDRRWFIQNWAAARTLSGGRFGQDFFRAAYHYFRVDEDPTAQADFYLHTVGLADAIGKGDLPAIVDVESAENPAHATAQQIIDAVSKFSMRIQSYTGHEPILYAGSYLRDRKVTDHMGCQLLWTAAYGSILPAHLYTDIGWRLDELFAWQFQGTESHTGPAGYPRECPIGAGPLDLSAITICNGEPPNVQLAWIREHLT